MDFAASTADFGDGTRCAHAGATPAVIGRSVTNGPVFASQYHLAGQPDPAAPAGSTADFYGRAGNPTWRELEVAIGELDGGHCVVLPSGMAAVNAVLRAVVSPGEKVVMPADGYYATRDLIRDAFSLDVVTIPTTGPWPGEVFDDVRLVVLETPSNPGLDVCDIADLAARAHLAGALVAVDNTTATPLGQRPLELGADIVIASDTKALTGHSDVLLGHVSTRDADLAEQIRRGRTLSGAIPGPFETWLALRSLGTLDLRLARQEENARALVDALGGHPAVRELRWPGLASDPAHPVAAQQMRRFSGVFCFELATAAHVEEFIRRSQLVTAATSFGGLHTTADRRAQWGDPVPAGFVRLSAGCEDSADLVADVLAALNATAQ